MSSKFPPSRSPDCYWQFGGKVIPLWEVENADGKAMLPTRTVKLSPEAMKGH